ncbi:MAG: ATP-binding protein, partial [Salinimicrobium sp.]
VEINFKEDENFYFFEVKDNGNGIPKESYDKIFDLFTTLDEDDRHGNPGSGIGLATVKKLLHHMGGDIEIESEPGRGSNFKFKIKRAC